MTKGPKKHLKRIAAPSHWMLDKLTGHYAPKPSAGPHKQRECVPLVVLLRNRLKYALSYFEVRLIVMQRLVKVDGSVRTDACFPTGFMDVISLEKTKQNFRMLLDTKGRYIPHPVGVEEASYKMCKVKKILTGHKGVPMIVTHDGRTIRFPSPDVKVNDTIRLDLKTGKIMGLSKFEVGNVAMATGGNNKGRVGIISHREVHLGGFDIIHIRDQRGNEFATRVGNVFVIGTGKIPLISLPKEQGIRLTITEDRLLKLRK